MTHSHGDVRLPPGLKVSLVHDWITQWGGSESVLRSLVSVFEGAPLYVGVWKPDRKGRETFGHLDIRTTWLQRLPGGRGKHRRLLPFMPRAFESLDVTDADLVFTSSHAFSKAVRKGDGALHICYCHTPPRYLWDLTRLYNRGFFGAMRIPLVRRLRARDRRVAANVDHFVANSRHVAGRIRRNYGREARVIYPPVDVERFWRPDVEPGDYFLTGGRLVPYKRLASAVEAATLAGFPLKVFGHGPDRDRLESLAGPTVEFVGKVGDDELARLMAGCRAFLFTGEEDFGILPVEAQGAGRPVIAWNRGGARETVIDGQTGVLYEDPSPQGLLEGIERFEEGHWRPDLAQRNALRFHRDRFEEEILEEVFRVLKGRRLGAWRPEAVPAGAAAEEGGAPAAPATAPALVYATSGNGHQPPSSGRRSLITGGAGFIGSHLAEALLAQGDAVDVVDDLSTGDRANIAHLLSNPRFQFYRGNVMDRGLMEDLVRRSDRVFHLAAAVGVRLIMERPVETVVTNVRGTEILLELASHYQRKILVASTSEVYGKAMENATRNGSHLREGDDWTLGPTHKRRWAYACSKAMDEFLALAYRDETDLPVIVARFFNTVGPRQRGRYGMVIPNFVKSALLGEPILVHGDGEQSRSFTHVADAVRAVTDLMRCDDAFGEVVNIGSGAEVTINELAVMVKEMTGSDSPIEHVPYEEVYGPGFEDMRRRTPDISKVEALVGYRPEHGLTRILQDVVAFYRAELGLPAPEVEMTGAGAGS